MAACAILGPKEKVWLSYHFAGEGKATVIGARVITMGPGETLGCSCGLYQGVRGGRHGTRVLGSLAPSAHSCVA